MKYNCQPARSLTRKLSIPLLASLGLFLSGCATEYTAPARVSPNQYRAYDCHQIAAEMHLTLNYLKSFGLPYNAGTIGIVPAVSAVVVGANYFPYPRKEQNEKEYAQLKGEYFALQRAAIIKKCPMANQPAPIIPDAAPENTLNRAEGQWQYKDVTPDGLLYQREGNRYGKDAQEIDKVYKTE
ncbi:hypothetical protein FACS1894158_14890 [Betaproteobacteria bacterium]|nr:hypothetical protein FACS1894158_14890 [Betaproteobacteria bacterium]